MINWLKNLDFMGKLYVIVGVSWMMWVIFPYPYSTYVGFAEIIAVAILLHSTYKNSIIHKSGNDV